MLNKKAQKILGQHNKENIERLIDRLLEQKLQQRDISFKKHENEISSMSSSNSLSDPNAILDVDSDPQERSRSFDPTHPHGISDTNQTNMSSSDESSSSSSHSE
mmetsp:Transcript_21324/g.31734  ORF Transcript_21324/g.31734 Transcript_21324/m.31734 type:complete len:104 (+) Transcript_21324:2693-3004(+)